MCGEYIDGIILLTKVSDFDKILDIIENEKKSKELADSLDEFPL